MSPSQNDGTKTPVYYYPGTTIEHKQVSKTSEKYAEISNAQTSGEPQRVKNRIENSADSEGKRFYVVDTSSYDSRRNHGTGVASGISRGNSTSQAAGKPQTVEMSSKKPEETKENSNGHNESSSDNSNDMQENGGTELERQKKGDSTDNSSGPRTKIVVIGNPGVGKSTLLNTMLGEAHFDSGLAFGAGLTTEMASYTQGNYDFVDTPGLGDVENSQTAAKEISRALRGHIKLIFVVILDNGRIRPADLSCVEVVLLTLEQHKVDVKNSYSIIINKCGPVVMKQLDEDGSEIISNFELVRPVTHIIGLKLDGEKAEQSNVMLDEKNLLDKFVQTAPALLIPETEMVSVDVAAYEEKKRAMYDEIREARGGLELQSASTEQDSTSSGSTQSNASNTSSQGRSQRLHQEVLEAAERWISVPREIMKVLHPNPKDKLKRKFR